MSTIEEKRKAIQNEVSDLESDLDNRIAELKLKVADTLSVKEWVKKYPIETVGVAAFVGFLLAYSANPSKSSVKGILVAEVKRQVMNRVLDAVKENFLDAKK